MTSRLTHIPRIPPETHHGLGQQGMFGGGQLGIFFKDGSKTADILVEYPLGHPRRRKEALPLLLAKYKTNLARRFTPPQQAAILAVCGNQSRLEAMGVHEFVDLFVV